MSDAGSPEVIDSWARLNALVESSDAHLKSVYPSPPSADPQPASPNLGRSMDSKWWFRGSPAVHNNLEPSLTRHFRRPCGTQDIADSIGPIEDRSIKDFAKVAHQFLHSAEVPDFRTTNLGVWSLDERIEWLIRMQHYRAPTRLLDWTRSLFIAMYFAVESAWDEQGELWACDAWALNHAAGNLLVNGTYSPNTQSPTAENSPLLGLIADIKDVEPHSLPMELRDEQLDSLSERLAKHHPRSALSHVCSLQSRLINRLVDKIGADTPVCFALEAPIITDRMHAQQGCFTVSLDPQCDHLKAITAVEKSLCTSVVRRFTVPADAKRDILRWLRSANISAHSLYPGIDGLGRSVQESIELEAQYVRTSP